jgi:hypothetical protein
MKDANSIDRNTIIIKNAVKTANSKGDKNSWNRENM